MHGLLRLPFLLAVLSGVGCGHHFLGLSAGTVFDERDDDAIVVLRVSPKTTVVLAKGIVEGAGWRTKRADDATQFWTEDGFVVARVTPTAADEAYGIIVLRPEMYGDLGEEPSPTYATTHWPQGSGMLRWGLDKVLYAPTNGNTFAPQPYHAATNVRLPAFKAIAGKVTFVGAIRVDASVAKGSTEPPDKIALTPVSAPLDAEEVAAYLAKHYPKVRGRVKTEPFQMLRRNEYLD